MGVLTVSGSRWDSRSGGLGRHLGGLALWILSGITLAGCSAGRPPLPLRPEPIPYADTLPIAEPPAHDPIETVYLFASSLGSELVRPFNLRELAGEPHEALNVTHFDDVVSSAWFEHRNGRRRMTPEEVARGPARTEGPDTSAALTVISGKEAGISPGFTIRDGRGDVYLFKFDPRDHLYLSSGADVIASRLFYAAGYHVPADHLVVFDSARLQLSPDAEVTTERGERRMTREDVRAILARTDTLPDGRFLALASKFLAGVPKGPFFFEGTRPGDPNDYYRHEYRRELRGLYVVASWLNHVDIRFANTLDVYVEPGYLRHHLIDFGGALGSGTIRPHAPREGREYNFDLWPTLARIFTLGFFRMGWEDEPLQVIYPSIGWMPVANYDPGRWRPNWPNGAFNRVTARDGYWGAKLVASFTDDQLRAVVDEAQLPHAAADTMTEILAFRRDRTVEHWFARVTTIENVEVVSRPRPAGSDVASETPVADRAPYRFSVAFDDLGIDLGVWSPAETRYEWHFEHGAFGFNARGEGAAVEGSRQTVTLTLNHAGRASGEALSGKEAIATLRIAARRPGAAGRAATVYLSRGSADAGYRVVGLEH